MLAMNESKSQYLTRDDIVVIWKSMDNEPSNVI